ncbi:MAG: hypothetical protein GXO39_03725 [Thermotogae bacterium]|nr:hypothetical protein [Thermotogota bacterium]
MTKKLKRLGWIVGIVFSLVAMSGCGGGGGDDLSDSSADTSIKETSSTWSLDTQNRQFELETLLTNNVDAEVTLDRFEFELGGCPIDKESLRFNGASDTALVFRTYQQTLALRITGSLLDPTCTPTAYILTYRESVEKDGKTRTNTYSIDLKAVGGSEQEASESGYTFYNIATPVHVTRVNTSYEIKAQLLKDGFAATGETVKLKPFDAQYGSVASATVSTDQNGYAKFAYTSPATLPPAGSTVTVTMVYTDANGSSIEADVQLLFEAEAGVTPEYNLTNISSPLTVQTPGELLQISAVVVDKNSVPVAGHQVSITAIPDLKYGSIISEATVRSDASGHVTFTYKAPENIAEVDGHSTTITMLLQEDSYTVSQEIVLNFDAVNDETPRPVVVIPQAIREINLTSNAQPVEMNIQVFEENNNNPYTTGSVKVKLPDEVLEGVDVGRFESYEVAVGSDGIARFRYLGPQNLKSLIDQGRLGATFKFYHVDNLTSYGEVKVNYRPQDDYVPANYLLETVSADGNYTMGLNSEKTFSLMLKDDQGTLVPDSQILEINISTKNFTVGKLVEPNSATETVSLSFSGSEAVNNKSFSLRTDKISGLVPVEISVRFIDANGEEQELPPIVMNVTVFSGPPTAISISYVGSRQDPDHAKFIDIFDVTVTDAYNNPVNTKPYIATGGMVEYAVDGNRSNDGERNALSPRLWYGVDGETGTLEKIGTEEARFVTNLANVFRYVDLYNDKLVLFGRGYVYEALGKWDITSLDGENNILNLLDNYYGETRSGLGFAVGHNNRQDLCSDDGREYVGNMRSSTYQVDSNGHVLVEFEYDYFLHGKDVMIWVNLTGFQADDNHMGRIGEAMKHTLRGMGLESVGSCTVAPGETKLCRFLIAQTGTSEFYPYGHFGASIVSNGTCTVLQIVDWSNFYDARDCRNGAGFIDLNVTNTGTVDCSVQLDRLMVSPEF